MSKIWLLCVSIIVIVLIGLGFLLTKQKNNPSTITTGTTDSVTPSTKKNSNSTVSWSFNGSDWKPSGTAPTCDDPLNLPLPVELSAITSILYPGQTRGQYKPHGGFRLNSGDITVTAPMDAVITRGSRYIEQGETQILLEFVNSCGIMYRFDHLRTLSPAMQAVVDTFPPAQVDDSRTTNLTSTVTVKKGDTIATAIGFAKTSNFGFDFGVYDLRQANTASKTAGWASMHKFPELENYATCWLDLLDDSVKTTIKNLPPGDQTSGKTSDYCK